MPSRSMAPLGLPGAAIPMVGRSSVYRLSPKGATILSPSAAPRLSEPLLARFIAETGVRVLPKQAWTDVASLQAHGIPAVNYGPGEAHQAHQPGEWVDGEAIARVATTLARFLAHR